MRDVTFDYPDWTAFCRLDGLGLVVIGQRVESDRAVLACRVAEPDGWCRRCGAEGAVRDSVIRRLAHEPFGWRPTTLEVTLRRYRRDRCDDCGHVWRQNMTAAAVAAGEDLPGRAPLGAGGDRVQPPDRGPDRYSPRSHPAEFRSAGNSLNGSRCAPSTSPVPTASFELSYIDQLWSRIGHGRSEIGQISPTPAGRRFWKLPDQRVCDVTG